MPNENLIVDYTEAVTHFYYIEAWICHNPSNLYCLQPRRLWQLYQRAARSTGARWGLGR